MSLVKPNEYAIIRDEPVASLEEHGLRVRVINMLEDALGAVYIRDLERYTRDDVRGLYRFGDSIVDSLTSAMESLAREMAADE